MNRLLLAITVISLIACQNQSFKENTPVKTDEQIKTATTEAIDGETLNFNSDSPLGEELKHAIEDISTDEYFLRVFEKGQLVPHLDDNKMLSISDSLFSNDQNKDFFYFVVFTKSLDGADGFYSEAAGARATEFMVKKTE